MNSLSSSMFLKATAFLLFSIISSVSFAQTETLCRSISNSLDDIEENDNGFQRDDSSDIELVDDDSEFGLQTIGLRFNNITIPQGLEIESAYVQFTVDETDIGVCDLTITGEDVDNSSAFDLSAYDVTTRTRTSASVDWNPPAWTSVGQSTNAQQTADISTIIQEIVSRSGFSSGGSISIFFEGTGSRTAHAYDGSPNQAPELCITYITCGTLGSPCNDGMACTFGDSWQQNCVCTGTPILDTDGDGTCDAEDDCPGFDNALFGTPCDDGNPLTYNDNWQSNCTCQGNLDLFINEIFLSGFNGSESGDHGFKIADWVELYNPSGAVVNLGGWYLSDDQNKPMKWQIPAGTVPANGFKVFTLDGSELNSNYSNFKIDQSELNEEVLLTNPQGVLVDIYKIRSSTQVGHSRGRITDGDVAWGVFSTPTKNASNSTIASDYCPRPAIDIASGAHPGPVTISIAVPVGFTARYEVNTGTNSTARVLDPTSNSSIYSSPLTFNTTTVIKVRLYDNSGTLLPGFIETNTYLIGEDHTIYTLSVSGKNNLITLLDGSINLYPTAHWEFFDETGTLVTEVSGNVNKHGQDSWAYPHRGFDIFARDETGYGGVMDHKFYDQRERSKFDRFIIRAAGDDNYPYENGGAHIRDAFVQTWGHQSELEMDHRSYRPCVVYINGRYWGVYEIREKVVHKSYTSHYYDQEEDDLDYLSYWGGRTTRYGSGADWDAMMDFIQFNNMGIQANFDQVDAAINLKSWTDYVIFNNYIVSKDWNNYNTAWWRGRNPEGGAQKWQFILWDMDASFGHYINYSNVPNTNFNASPCDVLNNSVIADPEDFLQNFEELIDENPAFRDFVANRYNDLLNTYWRCDYALPLLDAMIAEKEPEMARQFSRWGGNATTWQNNVQDIHDFMNARCGVIDAGLASCLNLGTSHDLTFQIEPANALAEIQTNSVTLPITPMTGSYYPSLPMDLIAHEGFSYEFSHWENTGSSQIANVNSATTSMTFSNDATITAHFDLVADKKLVINEIHYNPADSVLSDGTIIPGSKFEFIELKNSGSQPINMSILEFSDGITFSFDEVNTLLPGQFLVLAGDATWFQNKYGFAADGVFSGDLDNGGELLKLNTQVDDVDVLTYDDAGAWNGIADLGLYSLALIDADSDNNIGTSWSVQSVFTTPGAENIFENSGPSDLVINEIHYNPIAGTSYEFIEIVNTSDEPFDMQGVSFTDGIVYTFTSAFSLPSASQYPANYLVLAENAAIFQAAYGFAPYAQYGGKLSNDGELIVLQGSTGQILDALTYNDVAPWDVVPDAGLHSLALLAPELDNSVASNWGHQDENVTPGTVNFPGADTCPEDFDGDGVIGVGDFIAFNSNYGISCNGCEYDLDGDGSVNVGDFLLFNSVFGQSCPTQFLNPDGELLNAQLDQELENIIGISLNPELAKSIQELRSKLGLIVYPNPNEGISIGYSLENLNLLASDQVTISILDMTGKQLVNKQVSTGMKTSMIGELDFSNPLADGIYLLVVNSGEQRSTARFVVR